MTESQNRKAQLNLERKEKRRRGERRVQSSPPRLGSIEPEEKGERKHREKERDWIKRSIWK